MILNNSKILYSIFLVFLSFHVKAQLGTFGIQTDLTDEERISEVINFQDDLKLDTCFKTVTWNIFKGERKNLYTDLHQYLLDLDLVLLQEVIFNDSNSQYHVDENFNWRGYKSFKWRSGDSTGVFTGSRAKAIYAKGYVSQKKELYFLTPKATIVTKYLFEDNKELLVINLHSLNIVWAGAFKKELKKLIRIINEHSGPVILAGDFNTNTKKKYRYLYNKFTSDLNLTPVGFDPDQRTVFWGQKHPVDHVFIRGLEVVSSSVDKVDSSDHNPLFVNFCVK